MVELEKANFDDLMLKEKAIEIGTAALSWKTL